MHFWSHIAEQLATPAGISPRGRKLLGLLVALVACGTALQAQEINLGNAVMSISEGVTVTTEGGITLQSEAAIANDGTLELGGDWTNDGKGLTTGSKGRVVLNGKAQKIGGAHATNFQDLEVVGGTKELAADVTVEGRLKMEHCAVITHSHTFTLLQLDPLNLYWNNSVVVAESGTQVDCDGFAYRDGSLPFRSLPVIAAAAASPAGPSTSPRWKTSSHSPAFSTAMGLRIVPMEMQAGRIPNLSDGTARPSNGATAAILARYFSSEIDGEVLKHEFKATTRQPEMILATASSIFAQHLKSLISA